MNTLDKQIVADALNPAFKTTSKQLTYNQLEVFRLLAMGRTYPQIAAFLGVLPQSVQNLASRACKRAGITHGGWNRTRYIKEWLAKYDGKAPADPMDDPMF